MDRVMERFNQLTLAEKCIVVGGIAMFIIGLLFPWWSFSEGGFSASQTGFEAPGSIWSVLAVLLALAMAGIVLAERFGNLTLPDLGSITWTQAWGGAAGALVVLMLLKAWRISATDLGGFGWGFFLAIVAAAAVIYGAYLKFQEGGGSFRRM